MSTKLIKMSTLLVLTLTLSTGCVINIGGNEQGKGRDLSSVFGSLEVGEGKRVGDVSAVNGSVEINKHVTAEAVESVNGNIDIANNVSVDSVETVNGNIKTAHHFVAQDSLSTVNGSISIQTASTVGGDISTINGKIILNNVAVTGNVSTKNGSIYLRSQSKIAGDIVFEAVDDSSWTWANDDSRLPKLVIDPGSKVTGRIILKRKVKLAIENQPLLDKVEHHYNKK
jgi:DUF4097 and DUF4098 domain-containing protein YvlB